MTKTYDLYGTRTLPIEKLRVAVADALSADLEGRESTYLGGDYFLAGDLRGEHIVIQYNRLDDGDEDLAGDDEGEVAEPEFADYPVLLQVNATIRGDLLKSRLLAIEGLDFLRRSVP